MKSLKVTPPQLPADLEIITADAFVTEATLEACQLQAGSVAGRQARAVSLDEVLLEHVILAGTNLEKLNARDLIAKRCDFSACRASEGSLLRSALSDCRMTGWDINKGLCQDVTFKNCKLDMTNFRFAKFTRVRFVDCVLTEADFLNAQLHEVSFENCLLERVIFSQCTMVKVDFRTSQLVAIQGWQHLKGAVIDDAQLMAAAPYLANEIGIIVE